MELNDPENPDFLAAKIAFCDMETRVSKWLCAAAYVLIAQNDEQPEGIELNVQGVKLRLSYEGPADDSDDEK